MEFKPATLELSWATIELINCATTFLSSWATEALDMGRGGKFFEVG